jgi:hypothetical protein
MSAQVGVNHGLILDVTRRRYYAFGDNTYILHQILLMQAQAELKVSVNPA